MTFTWRLRLWYESCRLHNASGAYIPNSSELNRGIFRTSTKSKRVAVFCHFSCKFASLYEILTVLKCLFQKLKHKKTRIPWWWWSIHLCLEMLKVTIIVKSVSACDRNIKDQSPNQSTEISIFLFSVISASAGFSRPSASLNRSTFSTLVLVKWWALRKESMRSILDRLFWTVLETMSKITFSINFGTGNRDLATGNRDLGTRWPARARAGRKSRSEYRSADCDTTVSRQKCQQNISWRMSQK